MTGLFADLPLAANLAIFAASSAVVWAAGTRLAAHVDALATRSGLGHAFMGMLLLGGITSLPELATVISASLSGAAPLAVNNMLGSVAMNVLLLALADAVIGRDALTSVIGQSATLLQGMLGILLLAVVATAILVGDHAILGVGAWSIAILVLVGLSLWMSSSYERRRPTWVVPGHRQREPVEAGGADGGVWPLIARTAGAGAAILAMGFLLTRTGEAIAGQTGLGTGAVGLVLLAAATSLPEVSSIVGAVRLRRYDMAVGDVLGTNLINLALIPLADILSSGGPVLDEAGAFEAVAALLGLVLTAIFVVGLIERRDRTVFRMGYDSLAALLVYPAGIVLLLMLPRAGSG